MLRIRHPLLAAFALGLAYTIGSVGDAGASARDRPDFPPEDRGPVGGDCRICWHATRHGLDVVPLTLRSVDRCGAPCIPLLALRPSGAVRLRDLKSFAFQVDVDFEHGGNLEFRVNGQTVVAAPFNPTHVMTRQAIPQRVLERLAEERGELTWGYVPPRGKPELKRVRIVNLSRRQEADLHALRIGARRESAQGRHVLEGLLFYKLKLYEAAGREARAALALQPDEPHALALYADILLQLDERMSGPWIEAHNANDRALRTRKRTKTPEKCRLERKRRPQEQGTRGGC